MLTHSNQKILKQTDQEKNFTKQIYKENNQENWRTFWNKNHKEIIIISRIDLHVICDKKKNDRTTSQ